MPTFRLQFRRAGLLCALAVLCQGCATSTTPPPPTDSASVEILPAIAPSPRIDAVLGRRVVIPITAKPGRPVSIALWEGGEVPATVHHVRMRTAGFGPGDQAPEPWLAWDVRWSSEQLREGETPGDVGLWVACFDPPIDGAGHDLIINGERIQTNWLPPPVTLARAERGSQWDPWRPTRPAAMPEAALDEARFAGECDSPITRWRWQLARNGLHPDSADTPRLDDPIAEELARQQEDRWRVALSRLWGENPELAGQLKQRLSAIVEFGPGMWAPAWGCDPGALDRLLADLLDPTLSPIRRGGIAERWLEEQESGVAWVMDDGGTLDSSRRQVLASVGIANLLDRATLSWLGWKDPGTSPDLQPLAAMSSRQFVAAPAPDGAGGAGRLSAHVGRWSGELGVLTRPLALTPPGLTLTPFFLDWSMNGWLTQRTSAPPDSWATAALLHRPPEEPGAPSSAARSKRWEVFVECKLTAGVGDPAREAVYVYTGPLGRPTSIVRVQMNGVVDYPAVPGLPEELAEIAPPPTTTTVVRGADRWAFRVPLPPGSVERDGVVRLGLMRIDSLGRRSATPRPMLPWQSEPPRVAVDTTAWGGAETDSGR
ncbi:hypothetical protein PHYC_03677 [Phycisphaerales bacterium]|nr:hypothetical protein PHYC_03677 [Phycisphaerales bacterium]